MTPGKSKRKNAPLNVAKWLSNNGSRMSVLQSDYKDRLKEHGLSGLRALAERHPKLFETSDGSGTSYQAAYVRLVQPSHYGLRCQL